MNCDDMNHNISVICTLHNINSTSFIQLMLNIDWVSDYILTSAFKVMVGQTPVHCGHTCVQAGWTDVCPPWTLSCPTWFFSVILSQKEMIFLKDISQHDWSFNSLIFGNFIFSNFSNIYSGVGQTPVQPGQACVRWTIGCPCQGSQYCYILHCTFKGISVLITEGWVGGEEWSGFSRGVSEDRRILM